MGKPRKNPLDVVRLLKNQPWMTQKQISMRLEWSQTAVSAALRKLEVTAKRGSGHGGPHRYAILLPAEKQAAVTKHH